MGGPGTSSTRRLFREVFTFGSKDLTHWFPSHMARGIKRMRNALRRVDCIVEVHDARIPFAGRNPMFHDIFAIRPHLLILNKKDLADTTPQKTSQVRNRLKEEGVQNILYTECLGQRSPSVKNVIPRVVELIENSDRYHRLEENDYSVMVIGVPNVGKSSLINAMRRIYLNKGKATPVGVRPGVTRSLMHKIKVSNKPEVWLLDTPGIMTPYVKEIEVGMKLALCGTLQDHAVGTDVIADYLLYVLNSYNHNRYVDFYELEGPSDNIMDVLTQIAKKLNKICRVKTAAGSVVQRPDINAAATHMVKAFRKGDLGHITLD
ncbi:mitochondrial ribosome-associated GTPase 1-like isoform X1 [Acanthaster planci]|uniref:Mitochondrial GTPase 1 n=1 Tax=Acanthaster planci TaxID=133434 RepID=A0A8B7Y3M0_ACAPL|nr:mitochondrial ribosome-associated GTPase 1-like isoform X1 [Acanthaster planci]XP_022087781.1 mitochondrial ribosome-associated GTPase 1-like isoform X1 [Acanthaster planci]XP_022087783.1 mitochondrial ribosome-associated GTPase 1-like isoform X1 [Acanthaster planci]XP_022087784.1 mitochondrial ribosome-associated GTPase 1-like isoform X1 [Acanthaster planci]